MATMVKQYRRDENSIERLVSKKSFWIIILSVLFAYPLVRSLNRTLPEPLPIIAKVPEFVFTNEHGQKFGSTNLKGRFYLANFMFTSCPSTCAELMPTMRKVQKRLKGVGGKVAIVSFTVDPETDNPGVLNKYARDLKTNPRIWSFVTGDKDKLSRHLIEGYKVPLGEKTTIEDTSVYDIAHSNKIVLVDHEGNIRGYYDTDKDGINKLMIDLGLEINRVFKS
jgi:protein SCO1/2